MRAKTIATAALAASLLPAPRAFARGCIFLRQTAPLFGTTGPIDEEVDSWTIIFTVRSSVANTHYSGTVRQVQRETEPT